jgi:uncharacterized protein involved in exopolysaccharide biosynthesis
VFYPNLDAKNLPEATEQFERDLTVSAIPQSNIIELDLRNKSRDLAISTLKALIEQYLPYRASIFEKPISAQTANDSAMFASRLRDAETNLAAFSLAHGVSNLQEQTSLAIQQLGQNSNEQASVMQQGAEARAKLAAVRELLAHESATVQMFADSTRSQQVSGLTDSLVRLTSKRHELQEQYSPTAPVMQDIDNQIAALRAQIAASNPREGAASRTGRNPVYDELKNQEASLDIQAQGLQARQASLAAQAELLKARNDELVTLSQKYHDLQRTRDVLDQSYRSISKSNEESQLASAFQRASGANLRVIQPPDAPLHGRSTRAAIMAAGLVVGVLAAAATFATLLLLSSARSPRRG